MRTELGRSGLNEYVYKWDIRFLGLAGFIAAWSKDPTTKVGAVIASNDRRIMGTGYNGFPPPVIDDEAALHQRERKLALTVHAEMNAILNARNWDLRQAYGLYVSAPFVCAECAKHVVAAGIKRVVVVASPVPERWAESDRLARDIFAAGGTVFLRGELG